MDFFSIWQLFVNYCIDLSNFLRALCMLAYQKVSTHWIVVSLLSLCVFLLIVLGLVLSKRQNVPTFHVEKSQEFLICSHSLAIEEISSGFCEFLGLEPLDVLTELQTKYTSFFNLLKEAIKNRKSFGFSLDKRPVNIMVNYTVDHIQIHLTLNIEKIFDELPVPISINLGYAKLNNRCFNNFGKLQSTEFFTKGQFFLKHENVFKRESIFTDDINFSILFPIMKQAEMIDVVKNFNELPPMEIGVLNRAGDFLRKTEQFANFFNIETEINTFQDFLESIRSYLLYDQVFFADFKKYFLNLFSRMETLHTETYSTIDGKVILFKFIPAKDKIYFIIEDITHFFINKTQEFLFKDLKTKLLPHLSDFVVLTNSDGIVELSNCELIKEGEKITTAKTILKFFTTSENSINETNLSNNGKCLFVKLSIKDKIFKVKNSIITSLDKMMKILQLLNNTIDGSLEEYLKYIKFIAINIENSIKTLEFGSNRNYQCVAFDLMDEFFSIQKRLKEVFDFKNLNLSVPTSPLNVVNCKEAISLLIENVFLLAFKYQFNQKNLIIEDKNDKIYITLDGINKEEIEKIYSMFDLISNINIFSNIRETGATISVGFYFDKISSLTESRS